ncbi:NHL repeat-containing protein [Paucibacter sp. AS339]|uniref:NHL repeat-containing protein n=1 Tax=Paucibacter hankyongi TaxID=3133434 RepID=UPI0030A23047
MPTQWGVAAQFSLRAGDGHAGLQDGPGPQARFADPYGLALARGGLLYVADGGANNRIRRINPAGLVSTLAGGEEGFRDGLGAAAAFNTPSGLALDASGNLYVADTGNHAIRRISPRGEVTTLAGNGQAGFRDGPAAQAQFNGPIGVAVDGQGRVFVADTYNDRVRVISTEGQVSTLAGGRFPGDQDGLGAKARFDNPCALAVDAQGVLWVADSRNDAVRRISPEGLVSTLVRGNPDDDKDPLRRPISLALSHDGYLYLGVMRRGAILQVSPAGQVHVLSRGPVAQLARPAGMVLNDQGVLHVADAASYRVQRLQLLAPGEAEQIQPAEMGPAADLPLPATAGRWPLRPQQQWHEVVGTPGEVRGRHRGDSRDHLHEGLDVKGVNGSEVVAMADAKVSSPLATWATGQTSEGLSLDTLSYIHMRVGRNARGQSFDPNRFLLQQEERGRGERMRLRRGTRFAAGEVLGSINAMAHVHVELGVNGYKRNPLLLGFSGFADHDAPRIEAIELFSDDGRTRLQRKQAGRLLVPRDAAGVQLVVDAWDRVDDNEDRRRLGLHSLGYQILLADGSPAPGFEQARVEIEFMRLPIDDEAVKTAYAPRSGVTVHGSAVTRFRYVISNQVRDGRAAFGRWQTQLLPAGDYLLRIQARDFAGNLAQQGRDLPLRLY